MFGGYIIAIVAKVQALPILYLQNLTISYLTATQNNVQRYIAGESDTSDLTQRMLNLSQFI